MGAISTLPNSGTVRGRPPLLEWLFFGIRSVSQINHVGDLADEFDLEADFQDTYPDVLDEIAKNLSGLGTGAGFAERLI